jgi:hypothetical protein
MKLTFADAGGEQALLISDIAECIVTTTFG